MASDKIIIKGARVNNLKNINVEIPKNKLTVITGLSGSGKSSLAFDTIYAEGQRRYVESLSSYARQFLGVMDKPEVETITGLSPTIAINQRTISHNPRSTVGTITEIYDYLRLLFSRAGKPHCPNCGKELQKQTLNEIIKEVLSFPPKTEIFLLAPIIRQGKIQKKNIIDKIRGAGYIQVRFDNNIYTLKELEKIEIDENKKYNLEILVDKLKPHLEKNLLSKSLETTLDLGNGLIIVQRSDNKKDIIFSQLLLCSKCGFTMPDLEPRLFSFNSPYGACPDCQGLGEKLKVDPQLVIPNKNLSIAQGAIRPWMRVYSSLKIQLLEKVAQKYNFSLNVPAEELSKKSLDIIFYGSGETTYEINGKLMNFEGVVADLESKHREAKSDYLRREIEKYMRTSICPVCQGRRLKPKVLGIKINKQNIAQIAEMSIEKAVSFFEDLKKGKNFSSRENEIAYPIIKEIITRLILLENVGLSYLSLDRSSTTLAGGEAQRVKLAIQLGSIISGIIYILDEPTVGLHPRDVDKLIKSLNQLIQRENTVIVVEHDRAIILAADKIIDLGPGAGDFGGKIIAQGSPQELKNNKSSLTAQYLNGQKKVEIVKRIRQKKNKKIVIKGASAFNLKNINVEIPLGQLICLTGVSGSGKSTLMIEILSKALARKFYRAKDFPAKHKAILGLENINKVVSVDQSPIGRTPHSNPATYTGLFTHIRDIFTQIPEAKLRGYQAGHFSFNVQGGRCEACRGEGMIKVEMQFLPSVYVKCEECGGSRYNKEILDIHYKRKNIAQILDMSVIEAREFFSDIPLISQKLNILYDIGLGYLKLGQPATTLSGGEAQRIKLATELSRKATGKTIYLLDEPTTGLHFADVQRLLEVLNRLVDIGNTVLIIEHNLDVIKCADWIIDLGPEGGDKGGYLVASGAPKDIIKCSKSITGKYLKEILK